MDIFEWKKMNETNENENEIGWWWNGWIISTNKFNNEYLNFFLHKSKTTIILLRMTWFFSNKQNKFWFDYHHFKMINIFFGIIWNKKKRNNKHDKQLCNDANRFFFCLCIMVEINWFWARITTKIKNKIREKTFHHHYHYFCCCCLFDY